MRVAVLVLFAGCVPITSITSTPPRPRPTPPMGQPSGIADERAAMYEQSPMAFEQPAPLDATPRPCVAQNHCMRGGWFHSETSATQLAPQPATPVYPTSEEDWFDYHNAPIERSHEYRTEAATAATISIGRPTIAFCPKGEWPASEAAMLRSPDWYVVVVAAVDEATGTFEIENASQSTRCPAQIPIGNARVITRTK